MQRVKFVLFRMALGCALMCTIQPKVGAQVPWPPLCIQDVDWTSGTHHTAVTQPIEAPCSPSAPLAISGTADVDMVSGTEVHLMDGFHAGAFSGQGQFHAYVDEGLDAPADLVLIAPEPATHIVDNVVHVEKWEKLEVGLRLPQDYLNAIDSFFVHYYSNGTSNTATPDSVDRPHDLNPYADDSLQLVMTLTRPSGAQTLKWGFYMTEAKWTGNSNTPTAPLVDFPASPLDDFRVRFRLAPDTEGVWQFDLRVSAPYTSTQTDVPLASLHYSGFSFVCDPPLQDNHGFLHVNEVNRRTLQFDDGTAFFGLGTNMADTKHDIGGSSGWYHYYRQDRDVMSKTLRQLHAVGGNFVRMWLNRQIFAPEWVNIGVYDHFYAAPTCDTSGWVHYPGNCQRQCWAFDEMLDSARVNDIYIQLCTDPNYPSLGWEQLGWGQNAYVEHFLEPSSPNRPYDVKEYFFTDGNPDSVGSGVFYYWKRKYKYIMSRWGYSVNLPIIEPFNEVDQMLTYNHHDFDSIPGDVCPENEVDWPADPALPGTISDWLTRITHYVRDPVDTANPATSALGEDKKLFLMSYAGGRPPSDTAYYLPFTNPNVDLLDRHHAVQWEWDISDGDSVSYKFRDVYPNSQTGLKKPFHQGEFTTYASKNIQLDTTQVVKDIYPYFDNYDVSFHNEIWASTFFGNFAAGTSWACERVFWWPGGVATPDDDPGNQYQPNYEFSNVLGETNHLDVPVGSNPDLDIEVVNKPVHHNFKPLANMLSNPEWQAYDFFNSDFTAHCVYNDTSRLECYYLVNDAGSVAIGWVHNLNAFWENHFYYNTGNQNFLGCMPPNSQSVTLPGFLADHDFHITWFPTRMNATVHPADTVVNTGAGSVTLDLSTAPLGDTANNYLDTLHLDYGFIVSPSPIARSMMATDDPDTTVALRDWDFRLYPNPAHREIFLSFPDPAPREIFLYDPTGRQLRRWGAMTGPTVVLPTDGLTGGMYWVRAADAMSSRTKKLMIH